MARKVEQRKEEKRVSERERERGGGGRERGEKDILVK